MGGMGKTSDQSRQQKIYTLKNTTINEGILIVGLTEVNSNWSKISTTKNIYNRSDGLLNTRRTKTGYNRVTMYDVPFQSGGTSIMLVDEVSCRAITPGQEFRNLGL